MAACPSRLVAAGCALGIACAGSQHTALSKAGDERDEGAGELAQASLKLTTPANTEPAGFADGPRRAPASTLDYSFGGAMYGGGPYGGATYGGSAYGGATYASWVPPQWTYTPPAHIPRYAVLAGLRGSIEGTVTWSGAPPGTLASRCGPLDNPTLHVGRDRALRGAVVFIEKIAVGRATPYYQRPASVGGILSKRGCSLAPAVQLVAPLPGSIAIHGDATAARLRIATDASRATAANEGNAAKDKATAQTAMATTQAPLANQPTTPAPATSPTPPRTANKRKPPVSDDGMFDPSPTPTPTPRPPVTMYALQEGGIVQVEASPGITRIDGDDGALSAAWVVAIDSPYYAVTDDAGHFRIDELAPGTYDVTFWQPPVAAIAADGTFTYGAPVVAHRSISVMNATSRISVSLGR